MHSNKVQGFLEGKGFKREGRTGGDSDTTVSNYFKQTRDVADLPLCLCNDKPPQLHVQEYTYMMPGVGRLHSFDVGIRNEAPQGWIIFKFYSVGEDELITRYDDMATALLNAWRTLFTQQTGAGRGDSDAAPPVALSSSHD